MKTLANCFVTKIQEDNIESIYNAAYECARTYSYGGGIGVDISSLRPRDSVVHNAADKSTGAVSFMELFSMTTGLIGQSGRRGALMLTIDVKHPDILDFVRVKKVSNWVTKQIAEQCQWSGLFDDAQLKEVERQVRENTQVRFGNISIKVTDEFMQAVDEQTRYAPSTLLVYRKFARPTIRSATQSAENHYSYGIPAKDIGTYEFAGDFYGFETLNRWLEKQGGTAVFEETLADPMQRDVFGDVVVELPQQRYDLAVRRAGDFLLYYSSAQTGDIRQLVKARDVWDAFIEGELPYGGTGVDSLDGNEQIQSVELCGTSDILHQSLRRSAAGRRRCMQPRLDQSEPFCYRRVYRQGPGGMGSPMGCDAAGRSIP